MLFPMVLSLKQEKRRDRVFDLDLQCRNSAMACTQNRPSKVTNAVRPTPMSVAS